MKPVFDEILGVFKDVKGLIHAPSYRAMEEMADVIGNSRIITHGSDNFQQKLEEFYARTDNAVFMSPICQQGVDFKNDRARFQVITRVPYLNAGDEFISMKMAKDFAWYNYQSLIIFGQQIGRINRGPEDWGHTILMDERFNKYIARNSKILPKWLKDAIIFR